MTLEELERALDAHRLEVRWNNGNWHAVRRNGAVRHWRRPQPSYDANGRALYIDRWRLPCKTGFRDCFAIAPLWHDGDLTPDSDRLRVREP